MSELNIDVGYITRRRTELGLSERALGRESGLGALRIHQLITADGANAMTLPELGRIADVLACQPARLLGTRQDTPAGTDQGDVQTVGAALMSAPRGEMLHTDTLASGLGWAPTRVKDALDGLQAALTPLGLTVHRLPGTGATIRPADGVLDENTQQQLERSHAARSGLKASHVRLLVRIADGDPIDGWATSKTGALFADATSLLKMGVLIEHGEGLALHRDCAYSLGLELPAEHLTAA